MCAQAGGGSQDISGLPLASENLALQSHHSSLALTVAKCMDVAR